MLIIIFVVGCSKSYETKSLANNIFFNIFNRRFLDFFSLESHIKATLGVMRPVA